FPATCGAESMSRRASPQGESLDLLLDTICNMFGLFIFVAMLVALLVSTRGSAIEPEIAPPDEEFAVDDRVLAERRRSALERAIASIDESEIAADEAALAEARAMLEEAEREVQRRAMLLASLREAVDEERTEAQSIEESLPEIEAEIAALEDATTRIRETKEISVRTPRRRELVGRLPVQVVLWRDRAHLINDWSDRLAHPCDSWCTWNEQAVVPESSEAIVHYCWRAGGQHIDRAIRLRIGGGVDLRDPDGDDWSDLERDREWRRAMSMLDPMRHVISIKCDPDSFDAFTAFRAAIAKRGFLYDVAPVEIESGGIYRDTILEGRTTAQ
ncbi:MAG: hypothetical protein ACO3P9_09540, partial [Phycisphaerales bacterium]